MAYKNQTFKPRNCKECGAEYVPLSAVSKYCTVKCAQRVGYKKVQKKRAELIASFGAIKCQWCDEDFFPISINSKFCSDKCRSTSKYHKGKKKKEKPVEQWIRSGTIGCDVCGKQFEPMNVHSKYCSPPCRHKGKEIISKGKREAKSERTEAYKKYREANNRSVRNHRLKNWYGITVEQYDQMVIDQNGKCAICGNKLDLGRNTHVDHWHSGDRRVRGLLDGPCNTGLGMFKENKDVMLLAIAYLEKHWRGYHDTVEAADTALEQELY